MATVGSIRIGMSVATAKFAKDLDTARAKLNAFAAGIKGTLGGLGLALGLHQLGKATIGTAVGMESAMANLAKATDFDPAGLAALKTELLQLSTTIRGVKLDDLLKIATAGGKLGVAKEDLVAYTDGIARLSVALDDIPAEVLTEEIGKLNAVFRLGVRGSLQLGSAIDKVADSGVSSAKDILDVTQRISGSAKAAKVTAAESIALAGALLDTGTNAELGATSLQKMLMALNNVGKQERFAETLGVSAEDFAAKVRDSPISAIQEWLAKLKTLDAASQQVAIKGVMGKGAQGIGEIQKLAQQAETLAKYLGDANSEFRTLNQITSSYERNAATTRAGWEQAGNRLKVLGDTIGSALLPGVNTGLGLVGDLATGISDSFGESRTVLAGWAEETRGTLGGWGISLTGVIDGIGSGLRNLPSFARIAGIRFAEAITNIGEHLAVLPANLKIIGEYIANNWRKLVVDGITAIGASLRNLGDNLFELGSAFVKFLEDPTRGFEFEWTPLLDGFKATAGKLPGLLKPELTSMQDQIDQVHADIAERERNRGKPPGESDSPIVPPLGIVPESIAPPETEDEKALKERMREAARIFDATRTPLEKFDEQMLKLKGLLSEGLIDQDTFDRAKLQARDDLRNGLDKDKDRGKETSAAALERGSRESRSAILAFRTGANRPDRELVQQGRTQVSLQTQQLNELRRIGRAAMSPATDILGERIA